jgi:hypothetical protein
MERVERFVAEQLVKDQPGITAEFELDESGEVVRLVAQPPRIFLPKKGDGA